MVKYHPGCAKMFTKGRITYCGYIRGKYFLNGVQIILILTKIQELHTPYAMNVNLVIKML